MTAGPRPHGLTRRGALGILAGTGLALSVAACTGGGGAAPSSSSATADPDAGLRDAVAADEATLIALYDRVIAAHPPLSAQLTSLRDQHVTHAAAMGAAPASAASTAAAAPLADAPAAVEVLIQAELAAAEQRTQSCGGATTTDLTRTLALIAASEASHAEALRSVTS